jgi:UDP-glucose:(heptosyl)LPS alpha-1,3-glucosyltransferase
VIPSYYDPFANVTVEALAMGLYVISSPKNGGSEVIANEAMGDVFSEFSKEKLKDACLQAMKHPKTSDAARSIRSQVAYLDFPKQLEKVINSVGLLR